MNGSEGTLTYAQRPRNASVLVHIGLVVASFMASAFIEYGYFSAKEAELERRITVLEDDHFVPGNNAVTKDQFDEFQKNVYRELGQIEYNQKKDR